MDNFRNDLSFIEARPLVLVWVVLIAMDLIVLWFPPLTPPALSRPAGRKRGLTAVFGLVFELRPDKAAANGVV
ncbi:hypothetical protein MIZ03_0068 [Rhodoferax lithotrophicus]|uniref:Uncharacterized protein n=1 Tax=Rhodoferax lithotrophicus TaxID=2798804 RepID=A0ABM7MG94_9BURK|nr:hypothetical protein MIZ03_0068 [Rhodoferax sp. MIZ03]